MERGLRKVYVRLVLTKRRKEGACGTLNDRNGEDTPSSVTKIFTLGLSSSSSS